MMTPDEVIRRGLEAESLAANETLQAAFDGVEAEYVEAWKHTVASKPDEREKLWLSLQCLRKVRSNLLEFVNSGRLTQDQTLAQRMATQIREALSPNSHRGP